jgi:hypothetical protein
MITECVQTRDSWVCGIRHYQPPLVTLVRVYFNGHNRVAMHVQCRCVGANRVSAVAQCYICHVETIRKPRVVFHYIQCVCGQRIHDLAGKFNAGYEVRSAVQVKALHKIGIFILMPRRIIRHHGEPVPL